MTIIVRMSGKMCAALNQFFTRRHEDEKAKLQRTYRALKKDRLFLRFLQLRAFQREPPGLHTLC